MTGLRRSVALAAAVLLVVGCGGSEESTLPVAGVTELLGPYQTEPYRAFDQGLIQDAQAECADSLQGALTVQPQLILADGRGGSRLMLIYGGAGGDTAECVVLIDPNGIPTVDGAGSSTGSDPVQLGPLEIAASSGGSASGEESWSYLHGNVGSEIGGVLIQLADGTNITASLGGGRFAAWWPGEVVATRIRGFDRAGNLVADQPN
jgi:hypothetical protein